MNPWILILSPFVLAIVIGFLVTFNDCATKTGEK